MLCCRRWVSGARKFFTFRLDSHFTSQHSLRLLPLLPSVAAEVRMLECQVMIWKEDEVSAVFGSLADFALWLGCQNKDSALVTERSLVDLGGWQIPRCWARFLPGVWLQGAKASQGWVRSERFGQACASKQLKLLFHQISAASSLASEMWGLTMLMGSSLSLDNMVLFTECRETGNKSAVGTGNEE